MGVNIYYDLSWRDNLRNIMRNGWLHRFEVERLEEIYKQNLPDDEYRDIVNNYISEINSRLDYWQSCQ